VECVTLFTLTGAALSRNEEGGNEIGDTGEEDGNAGEKDISVEAREW